MKDRIEKLLKTKIGTSFIHEVDQGINVFKLTGYGIGVLIVYDTVALDKKFTKVIYATQEIFTTMIAQEHPNFDEAFVSSIKMMIEMRKRIKKEQERIR